MNKPPVTRLRFIRAKKPQDIEESVASLGVRIQIYGCPQWDGKKWVLWFVPGDQSPDIQSVEI